VTEPVTGPVPGRERNADKAGRPIIRALDVLRALNRRSYATLQELHRDTGLPKPTLHRILGTLCQEEYVARDPLRGIYHLTARVQLLSAGFNERCLITEVGAAILRAVTKEIRWPLAIGTLDGTEMVVRYSTMPFSPWAVRATTVNNRHPILGSAMGAAYLAGCDGPERAVLLQRVAQGEGRAAALARDPAYVARLIAGTHRNGFGLREGGPADDSTSIAVPIHADGHVAGVVSLTMFRGSLTAEALERYPPILRNVATRIGEGLEPPAPSSPSHSPEPRHP
jgi:IclR family transcriptional regulator, mhp operon transcriptional activator